MTYGAPRQATLGRASPRPTIGPMNNLSAYLVTRKWPARHPDRLQLYSLPTPNGVKVSIALEEIGLPYEPHRVSFDSNDQKSPEFTALNPYQKIPALSLIHISEPTRRTPISYAVFCL